MLTSLNNYMNLKTLHNITILKNNKHFQIFFLIIQNISTGVSGKRWHKQRI